MPTVSSAEGKVDALLVSANILCEVELSLNYDPLTIGENVSYPIDTNTANSCKEQCVARQFVLVDFCTNEYMQLPMVFSPSPPRRGGIKVSRVGTPKPMSEGAVPLLTPPG